MSEHHFIMVGARGDLATRYLLPALGQHIATFDSTISLTGVDMVDMDYAAHVATALDQTNLEADLRERLVNRTDYTAADVTEPGEWARILQGKNSPIIYFALPPTITHRALQALHTIDLPDGTMLCLEKPVGESEQQAHEINTLLGSLVQADHVFRVDHFLAMSATLNIGTLRSANRIINPLWNREHIDKISIVFNETLGLEGRAAFYDNTGALVDMIQSHLIQTMARVLADETVTPTDILNATSVTADVRRGRYTAGHVDGKDLPSYVDEEGVDPGRDTETWARITLTVDTDRWRDVPITLESGKAIGQPRQEITATFKAGEHAQGLPPNVLRLAFDSDDLLIELNVADVSHNEGPVRVTLSTGLQPGRLTAYGRVIAAILGRDMELSVSAQASEQGWRIIAPVLDRFHDVAMEEYPAGTAPGTH